jgi:heptosyltransferase I
MRILIIKPSSFGDIIQADPTLNALRKHFPGAEISWVVFDAWKEALSLFRGLDEVIVWQKNGGVKEFFRLVKELRSKKFDLVIDLQGLFRTAALTFLSGAVKKISVPGTREFGGLLVRVVFPKSRSLNAAIRSLETVRYLTGEKDEPVFDLKVPEIDKQKFEAVTAGSHGRGRGLIGIVPFARGVAKQWPAGYYKKLIGLLRASKTKPAILILGSEPSFDIPAQEGVYDFCGKTSIPELAYLLKECDVVVGGDTGPTHLAYSLGVPVIMMFGGSDVAETSPVGRNITILRKNYPCSPCRTRPICSDYPCLSEIKPEEVFDRIKKILNPTARDTRYLK